MNDREIRQLLETSKTIAVVGLSDKPDRDSYRVAEYLQRQGYRIIPVNPTVDAVLGEKSYASVSDIPAGNIRNEVLDYDYVTSYRTPGGASVLRFERGDARLVITLVKMAGGERQLSLVESIDETRQLALEHRWAAARSLAPVPAGRG